MIIYLVCFTMSCWLLKQADKIKNNKLFRLIVIFLSLLLPCLLSGLRYETIGTDVLVYVKPLFNCAKYADSFSDFLLMNVDNIRIVQDYEIGFTSIVFFVAKLTNNFQILLFVIQSLIIFPIYSGLKKFKCLDGKVWFSMLVFYLMFFNSTLNAMRQYIGIAFVFYGCSCLINDSKSKFKFFKYLIIGILFHNSSIIGLTIYFIYTSLKKQNNIRLVFNNYKVSLSKIMLLLIIFLGIFFIINSNILEVLVRDIGFERYSRYISGNALFSIFALLRFLPPLLLFFILRNKFVKENQNAYFYMLAFALTLIINQFSTANIRAGRIGYLFSIFNIVSFTLLCNLDNNKKNNRLVSFFTIIYLLVYWYYIFVYSGSSETIPYVFFK